MIHSEQSSTADMLWMHCTQILGRGWGSRLRPPCGTLIAAQRRIVGARYLYVGIYYLHTWLENRCISGDYAVDEILRRAGRLPYHFEPNQETLLRITVDSDGAKGLKE